MKKHILVLAVLFTVSFAQAQTNGNTAVKAEKTAKVKTTPAKKATKTVHHKVYKKATVHHAATAHKTVAKKGTRATVNHSKHATHKGVAKKGTKATMHHSKTAMHKPVAKKSAPTAKKEEKK